MGNCFCATCFIKGVPNASALYAQYVLSTHPTGRKETPNGCELASLVPGCLHSDPPAAALVPKRLAAGDGLNTLRIRALIERTPFFLDPKCSPLTAKGLDHANSKLRHCVDMVKPQWCSALPRSLPAPGRKNLAVTPRLAGVRTRLPLTYAPNTGAST